MMSSLCKLMINDICRYIIEQMWYYLLSCSFSCSFSQSSMYLLAIISCRDQLGYFRSRNMHLVLWTVNDPNEKKYFGDSLKLPYMTDTLLDSPEQQQVAPLL